MRDGGQTTRSPLPKLQRLGYAATLAFFLFSTVYALFINVPELAEPGVRQITVGHWMSETGVREGFDAVFREFERRKAAQGERIRITQSTIPGRGYKQWFVTQLLSGEPTDLIAMSWETNPGFIKQYFIPLTPYIGQPNPYNDGTPLEGMAWQDTFMDNMESGRVLMGQRTAECFQIAWSYNVHRVYVNLDLLESATGSREPPQDLAQWLADCEALEAYGRQTGQTVIPIATRGIDRGTLMDFTWVYFSQLNGVYNDAAPRRAALMSRMVGRLLTSPTDRRRMLSVVLVLQSLGRYFGEGFQAVDREQALFRFASGQACFYYTGSWIAAALLEVCPFDLGVITLPVVGHNHALSNYYTGPVTEGGLGGGVSFGIPKASPGKETLIELLQFMTSYEQNQVIASYCKFPPIVKEARFEGILQDFQLVVEGKEDVTFPFQASGHHGSAFRRFLSDVEKAIVTQDPNAPAMVFEGWLERRSQMRSELAESLESYRRLMADAERERTQRAAALRPAELPEAERTKLETTGAGAAELEATLSLPARLDAHRLRRILKTTQVAP